MPILTTGVELARLEDARDRNEDPVESWFRGRAGGRPSESDAPTLFSPASSSDADSLDDLVVETLDHEPAAPTRRLRGGAGCADRWTCGAVATGVTTLADWRGGALGAEAQSPTL